MRLFLDTEFNGFGGELLSLALVPWEMDFAPPLYLCVIEPRETLDPWVKLNVWPLRCEAPQAYGSSKWTVFAPVSKWAAVIADYLTDEYHRFGVPYIVADWPDDIRYFCQAIMTGPGEMASIPRLQFDMLRVDSYPTDLPGAVRHNALWDALVLRHHVKKFSAP